MFKLIQNEWIKYFNRLSTYLMLLFIAAILVLGTVMSMMFSKGIEMDKEYSDNWKTEAKQEITDMQKDLQKIGKKKSMEPIDYTKQNIYSEEIQKLNLYLKEDVKPAAIMNSYDNLLGNRGLIALVTIMVAVITSALMSREHQQGTIKLLLIRPQSRMAIYFSKLMLAIITSVVFTTLFYLFTYIIGLFTTKQNPTDQLVYKNAKGVYKMTEFMPEFLKVFGHNILYVVIFAVIAYVLSVITKNTAISLGITFALLFFGGLITNFFSSKTDLAKFLWPANWDMNQYILDGMKPVKDMTYGFSMGYNIIALLIIIAIGAIVFQKRDVAN